MIYPDWELAHTDKAQGITMIYLLILVGIMYAGERECDSVKNAASSTTLSRPWKGLLKKENWSMGVSDQLD
jgi:hypothetical protein